MVTSQNDEQVDVDQDTFITAQHEKRVDPRKGKLMTTQRQAWMIVSQEPNVERTKFKRLRSQFHRTAN
jgi:hypothetical protein